MPGPCALLAVLTTPLWGEGMDECVVVLHGLGRTANSMDEIEEKLLVAGYRVWNEGYPSRQENVMSLAAIYVGPGAGYGADASRMHFVTHSLGVSWCGSICSRSSSKIWAASSCWRLPIVAAK